jgi:hypothetical protein
VKCPVCSTEIADKAIVCYRCGTPTAIPVTAAKPAQRRGRGRLITLLVILAALVCLLVFTYLRWSL